MTVIELMEALSGFEPDLLVKVADSGALVTGAGAVVLHHAETGETLLAWVGLTTGEPSAQD